MKQTPERILKLLPKLSLMSNNFMKCCLEDNIPAVELILRIIMNKPDLVVKTLSIQHNLPELLTHEAYLDVYAVDSQNKHYNIEVQRSPEDANDTRARYYSSMLVTHLTPKGLKKIDRLPETWVIFIVGNDIIGKGDAIYNLESYFYTNDGSRVPFDDNTHIAYVNATYRGDDELGKLMSDFNEPDFNKINFPILAETVRHIKENQKGVSKVCKYEEEFANDFANDVLIDHLIDLINTGLLKFDELKASGKYSALQIAQIEAGLAKN